MPEELLPSPEPVPEVDHHHVHDHHEHPHEHEGEGVLDTTSKCGNKCADCLVCKKPIKQGGA